MGYKVERSGFLCYYLLYEVYLEGFAGMVGKKDKNAKKKNLIPLEKYKRVIHVEDRGRERELKAGKLLFGIVGILCLLYCLGIRLFMGFGTSFYLIWAVMGLGCEVVAFLCAKPAIRRKIPLWILRLFWVCFGTGLALLLMVEGLVLSRCGAKADNGADYVIVLGAQWRSSGPSRVLKYRLDAAKEYLVNNPETKVIVSGGQGANEPIAEADGMRDWLLAAGIEKDRILVENTSVNTYENLRNCASLIDKETAQVVIVTNDFHVFRAEKLAQAQGYQKVQGLAADSYAPMQVHNLFREFFGVTKDFIMGNLVYWEREE